MKDDSLLNCSCTRRTAIKAGSAAVAGLSWSGLAACGEAVLREDVRVELHRHPELAQDGGLARLTPQESGFDFDIWIYREAEGEFIAYSGECTHWGCDVGEPDANGFTCPCHGSTFTRAGEVTQGPAKSDLPRFDIRLDDDVLTILSNA